MTETRVEYVVAIEMPDECAHLRLAVQSLDDDAQQMAANEELTRLLLELSQLRKIIADQGKLFGRIRQLAGMEVDAK